MACACSPLAWGASAAAWIRLSPRKPHARSRSAHHSEPGLSQLVDMGRMASPPKCIGISEVRIDQLSPAKKLVSTADGLQEPQQISRSITAQHT